MNDTCRYVRLSADDMEYFRYLDPFERLIFASMPYGFAIGALFDDGESLIPAGILVGTATQELLTIEWIAVEPQYKYRGIGEQLLIYAYKMAVTGNIPEVAATILPEYGNENLTFGAAGYFKERLFTRKRQIGQDLFCQLVDFEEMGSLESTSEDGFISFLGMSGKEVKKYIDKLLLIYNATYSYPPDGFLHSLDHDLCFVSESGGKLDAAFLVSRIGDILMPIYYYAKSSHLGDSIIQRSIAAAAKKYGKGKEVLITMRQEETRDIVSKVLWPAQMGELLIASVADYQKIK
ncbi:MAG: hypothetical protein IJU77_03320 [Butyrivibrio sp.]|nr:hypothetical protein [Butyrivibrio sp.]